jgi:hypothetical protein
VKYPELAKKYNNLVRKHNSKVARLKEVFDENIILKKRLNQMAKEQKELHESAMIYERYVVRVLASLCSDMADKKELLALLDAMVLEEGDKTLCVTPLGFSPDAVEFAKKCGVILIEEPKGSKKIDYIGVYQSI